MSGFDDRKDAFEQKFAHDEELQFKVHARTSKKFGLWAAEQMGIEGAEAEAYAGECVQASLDEAGYGDVIRKVRGDFETKNVDVSEHLIDTQVTKFLEEAIQTFAEDDPQAKSA